MTALGMLFLLGGQYIARLFLLINVEKTRLDNEN